MKSSLFVLLLTAIVVPTSQTSQTQRQWNAIFRQWAEGNTNSGGITLLPTKATSPFAQIEISGVQYSYDASRKISPEDEPNITEDAYDATVFWFKVDAIQFFPNKPSGREGKYKEQYARYFESVISTDTPITEKANTPHGNDGNLFIYDFTRPLWDNEDRYKHYSISAAMKLVYPHPGHSANFKLFVNRNGQPWFSWTFAVDFMPTGSAPSAVKLYKIHPAGSSDASRTYNTFAFRSNYQSGHEPRPKNLIISELEQGKWREAEY